MSFAPWLQLNNRIKQLYMICQCLPVPRLERLESAWAWGICQQRSYFFHVVCFPDRSGHKVVSNLKKGLKSNRFFCIACGTSLLFLQIFSFPRGDLQRFPWRSMQQDLFWHCGRRQVPGVAVAFFHENRSTFQLTWNRWASTYYSLHFFALAFLSFARVDGHQDTFFLL